MDTHSLGDLTVHRVGFGAMQLAGPGVFGPPADVEGARAVLRRAVELGVEHIDTSQYYGPDVVNELIHDMHGKLFPLGIIALSLMPLVGYGGQISLCQLSFAGIGAQYLRGVTPEGLILLDAARLLDGDVAGGINAARYESRIDMCVGIGGSPEGIVTACAIKALGGFIQTTMAPKDDAEAAKGIAAGLKMDHVYTANELVSSDNTFFVATGVTDGAMLDGVRRKGPIIRTDSIVLRGKSGTIRRVQADYLAERWI